MQGLSLEKGFYLSLYLSLLGIFGYLLNVNSSAILYLLTIMTSKKASVKPSLALNKEAREPKLDYFKTSLLLFCLAVFWLFNRLYITPLLLGAIMAILTNPVYRFLNLRLQKYFKKVAPGLSALITVVGVVSIFGFLLNLIFSGFQAEIPKFRDGLISFVTELPNNNGIKTIFNLTETDASDISKLVLDQLSRLENSLQDRQFLISQIFNDNTFSRTLEVGQRTIEILGGFIIYTIIFLVTWSLLLVNGKKWLEHILKVLPFKKQEAEKVKKGLQEGVRNVVYASLASAAIHTTLNFILMLIFNIPNKFIISLYIMAITILPLSPAELAYAVPISLIFGENPVAALVLIPLAEVVILWVNYWLQPRIISTEVANNELFILTSILSGIAIFGVMGFIIGPVLMVTTQTIYSIWVGRSLQKKKREA